MGLIRGVFLLSNPSKPELAPVEVSALADTGAVHLCIPEHLAIQLSLVELERREVVLADGHRRSVPYVGPVEVRFKNRRCFTGAMVLGNEVLLGAIPMGTRSEGGTITRAMALRITPRREGNLISGLC